MAVNVEKKYTYYSEFDYNNRTNISNNTHNSQSKKSYIRSDEVTTNASSVAALVLCAQF